MTLVDLLFSLGVAFALGCDAFAVGLAVGTRNPCPRARFRLWFHFGLFQFLMPVIGWYVGTSVYEHIKEFDHWIAFILMFVIATRMLRESLAKEEDADDAARGDPTRGWSLVCLSIATSIDALGVGFSMGIARMELFKPAVIIGIIAALMTYVGLHLGSRLSHAYGKKVETAGAVILYLIAFKLLTI
ncbi:MAG TPA: manganese efflux pump [Candidatus Riflebacteria bacterium]|jgi:putative Mn2+ efflux pump MntP|nr:manganese efflux pump [Candidatus Riflebacteria bacterium]